MVKYSSGGGFWDNHVHASPYFMYQMKHRCRHGYDQLKGRHMDLCDYPFGHEHGPKRLHELTFVVLSTIIELNIQNGWRRNS